MDEHSTKSHRPADVPKVMSYSLAELLIGTTLVAVLAGLYSYSAGWGILAALIVAPVSLRTFLVLRRRATRGIETTRGQRIGLFFASLAVAIAMCASLAVLVIVSVVAFFAMVCSSGGGDSAAYVATWAISLVLAGLCLFWFFPKWILTRWRRDLGISRETNRKDPHEAEPKSEQQNED